MQQFKHPCILWGIHLPDIVLPWQKYSCQSIPFIHKLQFSFEERHNFLQERVSLQNIKQSSEHAAAFIRNVVFLPFTVRCSLPSIIQDVFQNIRFLHNMQYVIDMLYCCQKGAMILLSKRCNDIVVKKVQWSCTLKIPWKKKGLYWRNMLLYIPSNKKQISCKGNIINAIHPLMRFGLVIMFSPWHLLLTKGFHFFKKNCHEDKIIPEIKNTILADIQYMNTYNTFLMKLSLTIFLHNICLRRKDSTS